MIDQNQLSDGHGYITWTHELGHHLGYTDLYEKKPNNTEVYGGIDDEGLMADFDDEDAGKSCGIFAPYPYAPCRIAPPLTSVSMTQNLFDIDQNAFLTETIHTKTAIQNNNDTIQVQTEALLNKSYGDTVHVIDTEEQEGLTGPHIYYNIEARGTNYHEPTPRNSSRVVIYRKGISTPISGDGEIVEAENLKNDAESAQWWLEDTDEYILDLPTTDSNYFYKFELTNTTGQNHTYTAEVQIGRTIPTNSTTLATMSAMNTEDTTTSTSNNDWTSAQTRQSDRDLLAIDTQGRIVGRHPNTGEYVNQIPDARASGDRHHGMEWILLPDGVNATFYVHTTNTTSTTTSNATLTITHYGNHAQLKGNTVTNTTTTRHTLTPQPNTYTGTTGTTHTATNLPALN